MDDRWSRIGWRLWRCKEDCCGIGWRGSCKGGNSAFDSSSRSCFKTFSWRSGNVFVPDDWKKERTNLTACVLYLSCSSLVQPSEFRVCTISPPPPPTQFFRSFRSAISIRSVLIGWWCPGFQIYGGPERARTRSLWQREGRSCKHRLLWAELSTYNHVN